MNKKDIKCRIYEDDLTTWVPDFNYNVQRKETKTNVINYFHEIE